MGSGVSSLLPCLRRTGSQQQEVMFASCEALDETLGHSFCYVRSSNRFLSPTSSDRFVSPSHSLRFDDKSRPGAEPGGFRAISGASVSANTSTPRTILQLDYIHDDATGGVGGCGRGSHGSVVDGFESTSSFCALPLQPAPRGGDPSGPMDRGGFFLSGPIERGAFSGPLDAPDSAQIPFSAPLGGPYLKKKRKKGMRKAFYRSGSQKKRPWVVPVLNFVGRKEDAPDDLDTKSDGNVQWALGKAGEDRVHVVVSEEHGWLFVGIYDGFNGPDAPEFLMGNLYRALYKELRGLFWDVEDVQEPNPPNAPTSGAPEEANLQNEIDSIPTPVDGGSAKRVTFQVQGTEIRRRRLWEFLQEAEAEDGLDLSGSGRFAFSVDDALSVSNAEASSAASRRWLLLSKLKHGLSSKHKEGHGKKLFPWKFGLEEKDRVEVEVEVENKEERSSQIGGKRRIGPVDHKLVLRALSRALEATEIGYLDMTDKFLDTNPELALMGSCLLVALMRDEDVYVMNVGDSRAIVAQYEPKESSTNVERLGENTSCSEGIVEESSVHGERGCEVANSAPSQEMRLTAQQLSTDHSTSIEEEITRIKNEHPDDTHCIVNDRVKGRLKVTRAFGAGFLKQPKFNNVLLEMFRNEYIGTAPYITCTPSLRHHKLCQTDQFLILSSDGLYQYLTNQEVVSFVENFMERFPDGDPAQHLIQELLFRAAKKAGMDFHELLDIPQGDRRKYHDDVTVMVISLEGRIWKSSGKYF